MKIIYINTSNNKQTLVELKEKNKIIDKEISSSKLEKSEAVLPLINELLKRNNLKISDIDGIEVFEGPGSFTGLRVGVSIANALGFLLGLPVNGKKVGTCVSPVYN